MIICKICNTVGGNGYCGKHSTGGSPYLEIKTSNCTHNKTNKPINNLQDLIDMMKFDNPDIQSLFKTAYNRGYQDGIKDTKESIKKLL